METLQQFTGGIERLISLVYQDPLDQFTLDLGFSSFIDDVHDILLQQDVTFGFFTELKEVPE